MTFSKGDIVRYAPGSSALVKLDEPHAGGWHGIHCLGGYTFVSESSPNPIRHASPEEVETWHRLRNRTLEEQGRRPEPAQQPSPAQDVAGLVAALHQAKEWLEGWASAKPQLAVINAALAAHEKRPGYMAGAPLLSTAAQDVLAERNRQITAEGWTPAHDDEHGNGELARAAGFYALHAHDPDRNKQLIAPNRWPWDYKWWKPGPARRMLVKAGALIIAEVERLDRASHHKQNGGE